MATKDKSHLEWHGKQWRVTVLVPKAARPAIGKAHLKQSLGTHSLEVANLLKHPIISRFKSLIEEAMRTAKPGDIFQEAQALRAARQATPKRPSGVTLDKDREGRELGVEIDYDDNENEAIRKAEYLFEEGDEEGAIAFADIALGRATPLKEYLQAFKDDHAYQPKSILELDRALNRLGDWLASTNRKQTLEGVTSDVANSYMRYMIHGMGLSAKSGGKYISFLRAYWKWLGQQKRVTANSDVWSAPLPKAKNNGRHNELEPDEGKRPYTAAEMKKLLAGTAGDLMVIIKIGALTGMRIEEIYRLRVRDVVGGFFLVRDGKTVNAKRRVPIHTDLEDLVERLTKGKESVDYLVDPDAPVIVKTGLRSGAASKAFGRYRVALGLDERPNKKAKSNIDFHSLRRWFVASARDGLLEGATGYNQWTIADVVGHGDGLTDTLKMTLGVYPGKSADAALKACVAAVQLP